MAWFLKLRLKFHTSYKTHPIVIKYKGSAVDEIDLHIDHTEQKEEISFEDFYLTCHHFMEQNLMYRV